MSSPEKPSKGTEESVPPTAPAYSTPPPEGVPSADDEDSAPETT